MTTNTIIEIIRAHENPCAILERLAPRFAPFELAAALKYAADTYGQDSPVLLSVMLAHLGAHHRELRWSRVARSSRHTYEIERAHAWGVLPPKDVAAAPLRIRRQRYELCCRPSQAYISLSFEHDGYLGCSQWDQVYQQAFVIGMEDHGAAAIWDNMEHHEERWLKELRVATEDWERLVGLVEELLLGDQIMSFDAASQQWQSGPLLERAWRSSKQHQELLTRWLDPHEEDDDIPF